MKVIIWIIGILILILLGGGLVGVTIPQRRICFMILVLISAALLFFRAIKSKDTITIFISSVISLTMLVCVYFYFRQSFYFTEQLGFSG